MAKRQQGNAQAQGGARVGMVIRCTAVDCGYNRNQDCAAPNGIEVRHDGNHADCTTYTLDAHRASAGTQPPAP